MGIGKHGLCLGRTGADHSDLDAGVWRDGGAGGHRRHGERDPAISHGRVGSADDAHTADAAASSGASDALYCSHTVGRVLSSVAAGVGLVSVSLTATLIGYQLAANLPQIFAAAILLLTPLAFLLSTARNCRQLADVVALVLGLALFPLVSLLHTGVDILISGVSAGTIAYGIRWWRRRG